MRAVSIPYRRVGEDLMLQKVNTVINVAKTLEIPPVLLYIGREVHQKVAPQLPFTNDCDQIIADINIYGVSYLSDPEKYQDRPDGLLDASRATEIMRNANIDDLIDTIVEKKLVAMDAIGKALKWAAKEKENKRSLETVELPRQIIPESAVFNDVTTPIVIDKILFITADLQTVESYQSYLNIAEVVIPDLLNDFLGEASNEITGGNEIKIKRLEEVVEVKNKSINVGEVGTEVEKLDKEEVKTKEVERIETEVEIKTEKIKTEVETKVAEKIKIEVETKTEKIEAEVETKAIGVEGIDIGLVEKIEVENKIKEAEETKTPEIEETKTLKAEEPKTTEVEETKILKAEETKIVEEVKNKSTEAEETKIVEEVKNKSTEAEETKILKVEGPKSTEAEETKIVEEVKNKSTEAEETKILKVEGPKTAEAEAEPGVSSEILHSITIAPGESIVLSSREKFSQRNHVLVGCSPGFCITEIVNNTENIPQSIKMLITNITKKTLFISNKQLIAKLWTH